MTIPATINELVERFRDNFDDYQAPTYKEFRLRKEFVDPFFDALGWDVANKGGFAEAYKDVVHEDSIKIAGSSKAPDYAFRVGGTRKFFVETKAPNVGIKTDALAAYQLRRYGWSAKLPLSILTDFTGFAVYDCRIKPVQGDKVSKGRLLYIGFEDYKSRWDEIAAIFSQQAILKGAFDRYSNDSTKKRGTAEVDTAFLAEIEGWRESLAKSIARRNALSIRDLNTAVQRTIDRIIFLRIAEARGFEQYGTLQKLAKGSDVYKRLTALFRIADDRYNSGLFHFKAGDGSAETLDTFSLNLTIEDKPLKELFSGLYFPESPYEFSVLPADILGQVYEQFLGKVITLQGKVASVETKVEVKKAGGVFYTPTYIAKYIVEKTLTHALQGRSPGQISGAKPLRIIDPACGSGSFLIVAYQYLIDWFRDWYVADGIGKHSKGKSAKLYQSSKDSWRLTIAEKRRILLTHIYGVDVDAQAVEVTKLSLLMKVLEGEKGDALAAQTNLFKQRALPDLGSNIRCGNSLITSDIFSDENLELFSEDQKIAVNAFDWEDEFEFKFDVVIGNPPYGANYTIAEKNYFQNKYVYREGKPETYLFFLEKGVRLLSKGGIVSFIIPNAWLTNFYGVQMRKFLLNGTRLVEVADLEPVSVFKAAVVDTCIITLFNSKPAVKDRIDITRIQPDKAIKPQFVVKQSDWTDDPEHIFNVYADESDINIMRKMQSGGRTFLDILEFSQGVIPYLTKAEGLANAHISATKKGKAWLPLYESAGQIEKFKIHPMTSFINYGPWLNRSREARFFEQPKILFHRVRKKLPVQLVGAIDEEKSVNRHALSNLILRPGQSIEELWAALALFNSHLGNWWFVKRYGPLMEVGGFKVMNLPLPSTWESIAPALAQLGKDIARALKRLPEIKGEHERKLLSRTIVAKKKAIEQRLANAFALNEADFARVTASLGSSTSIEKDTIEALEEELEDVD